MDRPHWEPRRGLVAMVSLAATQSVVAKAMLLAMALVRRASARARRAEMLSAAPAWSSVELAAFVQTCYTQPPGQSPSLMKPLTNL